MVTPAENRTLCELIEIAAADGDAEIVCEGRECWVGSRRISKRTVNGLLRLMAISRSSYGGDDAMELYTINLTGRSLIARPAFEAELLAAIAKRKPFMVTEDHKIKVMPP